MYVHHDRTSEVGWSYPECYVIILPPSSQRDKQTHTHRCGQVGCTDRNSELGTIARSVVLPLLLLESASPIDGSRKSEVGSRIWQACLNVASWRCCSQRRRSSCGPAAVHSFESPESLKWHSPLLRLVWPAPAPLAAVEKEAAVLDRHRTAGPRRSTGFVFHRSAASFSCCP